MAGPLRFGRYETLFRIASGGMAEVFAARVRGEAGFEKLVAVKRMVPHLAEDASFVHMFLDEARLAAQVSSPHVVQTLDLGRADDGSLYIAMELIVGVTLSTLTAAASERGERVPAGVAIEIAAQAADGLHDAHEARAPDGEPLEIVHRDVSPQNVLVGVDGRVKVTDFGIARAAQGRLTHTEHGQLKGKLAYFSPEQSRAAALDRRSDVFALGVVLWEMLAGDRLFAGPTPAETIVAVRRARVPDLHARRPEVPASIARIVERALAREPRRRPASAADLARQLRSAAHDADLAVGNAGIAAYLREADVQPLAQLRERIRAALESPDVGTLPDIEIEPGAPLTSTTGVQPRAAREGRDPRAVTAILAPQPEAPGAALVHHAPTVLLDPPPPERSRAAWIAGAAIGALVIAGVAAYGVSLRADGEASHGSGRAATSAVGPGDDPSTMTPSEAEGHRARAIDSTRGAAPEPHRSDPAEARSDVSDGSGAATQIEPDPTREAQASAGESNVAPRVERGSPREGSGGAVEAGDTAHPRPPGAEPARGRTPRPRAPPARTGGADTLGAPAGLDAFERGVRR